MLCAVEYRLADGSWWTGHHGVDLRDPTAYVQRLARNGVTARTVESGECPWCNAKHPPPYDGGCLL